MTNLEEQGIRFERLLEALNTNQSGLARKIKVSPSLINQITKGKKSLSNQVLVKLTNSYSQVNTNWLLNNEGEMFLEKKEVVLAQPEAGVLTGVMEREGPVYEKGVARSGVLESALHRLSALEDKMVEMEDRLRALEEGKGE